MKNKPSVSAVFARLLLYAVQKLPNASEGIDRDLWLFFLFPYLPYNSRSLFLYSFLFFQRHQAVNHLERGKEFDGCSQVAPLSLRQRPQVSDSAGHESRHDLLRQFRHRRIFFRPRRPLQFAVRHS